MKKSIGFNILASLIITIMTGCAGGLRAPFVPPQGAAFSQTSAPLDVEFKDTKIAGTKTGKAEIVSILGLFTTGDASSKTAAANGGITTIEHADYEQLNILGIYRKTTVIVYGN